jgi:hypothetical protein
LGRIRIAVALLLAAPAAGSAAQLRIAHEPVACVPTDRHLRISATGLPAGQVRGAELQFRVGAERPWYAAVMTARGGGEWQGILPRPGPALREFEYRIVMTSDALARAMTAPVAVRVADADAPCDAVAQGSLDASIVVRVPAGAPLVPPVPPGFSPAGVITPRDEAKGSKLIPLLVGAAGAAGVAGSVANDRKVVAPPAPDIPTFAFTGTSPHPGTVLSLSRTPLVVFITMSREPNRAIDLAWRLELRSTGVAAPVCLVMEGVFAGARRPVSLALLGPLSATGACGERFEVNRGRLTVAIGGEPVFDAMLSLPFRVEP